MVVASANRSVRIAEGVEKDLDQSPLFQVLFDIGIVGSKMRFLGTVIDQDLRLPVFLSRLKRIEVLPLRA